MPETKQIAVELKDIHIALLYKKQQQQKPNYNTIESYLYLKSFPLIKNGVIQW